jgi:hypothetical protein
VTGPSLYMLLLTGLIHIVISVHRYHLLTVQANSHSILYSPDRHSQEYFYHTQHRQVLLYSSICHGTGGARPIIIKGSNLPRAPVTSIGAGAYTYVEVCRPEVVRWRSGRGGLFLFGR